MNRKKHHEFELLKSYGEWEKVSNYRYTQRCFEKDLLCALAKTSDKTLDQFKHSGLVAKQRECVVDELSKSTSDENLLSLLKGDRETAGDMNR